MVESINAPGDALEKGFGAGDRLEKGYGAGDDLEKGIGAGDGLEKGYGGSNDLEKGYGAGDDLEKGDTVVSELSLFFICFMRCLLWSIVLWIDVQLLLAFVPWPALAFFLLHAVVVVVFLRFRRAEDLEKGCSASDDLEKGFGNSNDLEKGFSAGDDLKKGYGAGDDLEKGCGAGETAVSELSLFFICFIRCILWLELLWIDVVLLLAFVPWSALAFFLLHAVVVVVFLRFRRAEDLEKGSSASDDLEKLFSTSNDLEKGFSAGTAGDGLEKGCSAGETAVSELSLFFICLVRCILWLEVLWIDVVLLLAFVPWSALAFFLLHAIVVVVFMRCRRAVARGARGGGGGDDAKAY